MSHKKTQSKISSYQGAALISNTMLGAGLLTMPRALTLKSNSPDGWIALGLEGIIFIFLIYLNTLIMKKHQYPSFFEYMNEGLGKWAGNIVNLMICLYLIGVASFEARAMAEMVKFFLLERTPVPVTLFIFIACSVYLIIGGMSDIGRLFPFYLTITIIILLIVFAFSFKIFNLDNLRPVLGQGFSSITSSLTVVSVSFLGIEVMLFLPEYLKNKKDAFRLSATGFSIPIILYMISYVIVVGALTTQDVQTMIWPTIALFQSFELKGLFIERFESFLLAVWIVQFFTTYVSYGYFATSGLKKIFGLPMKKGIIFVAIATYFGSLMPKDANVLMTFSDILGYIFFGLFLLPLLLFIVVAVKRKVKAQ
ncbi:endospore germination permease [Bacillus sp. ISL-51]|uniref:endospore germination permease n=1 Tax=Bacteria TaxID=2 RepID=UPI001BE679BF|nr:MULTISPECIES: endospore germination permease [Bacteria]MBT2574756.1 endospore germination permease [Bacillus sp. ISL-51]MBT2635635.1 endospore germination permease [Bacillus sp. ISL-26]MBT2714289.1 endospore germination permease [Pseudomonas sp. ISL-88]